MTYSLVHTGLRLLPLLAALMLALPAQADRDHRRHDHRLQGYDQPYGQYRHQGFRHRLERRHKVFRSHRQHKAYRHYRKHKHYRPNQRRLRVVEPYYYSPPYVQYRSRRSTGVGISVILPLGSLIRELPGGSVSLHFNGTPYYYHGGNYYRPHQRGYRVVAPPGQRW